MDVSRRRPWVTAAAAVLAASGAAAIAMGVAGQQAPPEVRSQAASSPQPADRQPGEASSPGPSPAGVSARGPVLERSAPVSLRIPAIDTATSSLVELGLTDTGELEVPAGDEQVGWYRNGPTPGQLGPAVLAGHVDSAASGPAVFFRLAELKPGDEVLVQRADGRTAVFAVDRVEQHPKDAFPTLAVYGDIDHSGLRLVTCGGTFDDRTRHYRDNVVVYAHLVDVR